MSAGGISAGLVPMSYFVTPTEPSSSKIEFQPGDQVLILGSQQKESPVKAKCSTSNSSLKSVSTDNLVVTGSQFAKTLGNLGFYNHSLVLQAP